MFAAGKYCIQLEDSHGLKIYRDRDGIGGCLKKEVSLTEEVTTLRRHMAANHGVGSVYLTHSSAYT